MQTIVSTLIYSDKSTPSLNTLQGALNARLRTLGIRLENGTVATGQKAEYSNPDWQVVLNAKAEPVAETVFHGSMDSVLSQTVIGILGQILANHKTHIQISVLPVGQPTTPATWLTAQQVTHSVTSVVAQAMPPAAILWQPSHQLLTGDQYSQMAKDPTPWPLFANVYEAKTSAPGCISLRVDNAADFIGRPILFPETGLSLDLAYAAALSFLRHAVESGAPIPDGHSFGPEDGYLVKVTHATATKDMPFGSFVLRSSHTAATSSDASETASPLPTAARLGDDVILDQTRERTRSLAISYLMLVLLPPVGLVLLFSNALMRPSSGRTGLVAMTALAIVMVIGAYTFLNIRTEDTAALKPATSINVDAISD